MQVKGNYGQTWRRKPCTDLWGSSSTSRYSLGKKTLPIVWKVNPHCSLVHGLTSKTFVEIRLFRMLVVSEFIQILDSCYSQNNLAWTFFVTFVQTYFFMNILRITHVFVNYISISLCFILTYSLFSVCLIIITA